ncbi:hypothetical protein RhiJN_07250 [Ceratobasidium sp. AG-Ba]|nr:hypothetical protein RhiJN_07250 [Ceratobasidium sp. AG-Ba]
MVSIQTTPLAGQPDVNHSTRLGCQDVVKKPKLDNHGARCHASFTCIDCSKTFAGPAQWKSHTSCISEEQKYQKSVYQEPRGRGRGRGQRGRGGARGGFARAAYNGSGENSIPLGSQANAWTAPPPDPVNNTPFNSSEWKATTEDVTTSTSAPVVNSPESVSKGVEKSKKSKKRKTEDSEITEPTGATPPSDGPAKKKTKNESHGSEPEITHDKKEKKKKKKSKEGAADQGGDVAMTEAVVLVANGKEKKSKKSRRSEGLVDEEPAIAPTPASTHDESSAPPGNESGKKKKSRKSKASEEPSASIEQSPDAELVANGHSTEKKRKSRESNSDNPPSALLANDTVPVPMADSEAHLAKKDRQKKAKKEKKEQAKAEAKAKGEAVGLTGPTLQNGVEFVGEEANGNEAPLKSKKSKKDKNDKKDKKGYASAVNGIQSTDELEATNGDAPKSKKKSKREKKSDAVEMS